MTAKKYLQQSAVRTEKFIITKKVIIYIYMSNEYDSIYCDGKRNIISFMYFGYHYKIIKTVNKEHFIHLN